MIRQNPKETAPQFLFRALKLRNKVLFPGQEGDSKFDYGLPLIQNTFLKSLEAGLLDDILVTNLFPILRGPDLQDEDLIKNVNELAFNQEERQSKFGSGWPKAAKVNATKVTPASGTIQQTKAQDGQLLAEIREMRSEISALKKNAYNRRSPRSQGFGAETEAVDEAFQAHAVRQEVSKVVQTKDWGTPVNTGIIVDHPSILGSIALAYSSRKREPAAPRE